MPPAPGVDFQERVVGIRLAVEQCLKLFLRGGADQRGQSGLGLFDDACVPLHLAQFDQLDIVLQTAGQELVGVHRVDQVLPLAHQLLRLGRIAPQVGRFDQRIKLLQPVRCRLPIQPLRQKLQRFLDGGNVVQQFGAHGGHIPKVGADLTANDEGGK